MKKIKLAMAAMGAFALWTSCSNEEFPAPAPGGDGSVTFTATLPANINSRAYGDGEVAKTLHYAVYESGSDAVVFASDAADSPSAIVVSNTQFTLTLQLVKGKSYDFIFWADATEGSPYTFTSGTKSVSVSYEDLSGNNENRDAFFQTVKGLEISGPIQQPVELRRPFAQFNILTSDLAAVTATGTAVAKVDVTVKGVRNSLNLYSGIADGAEEVTFTSDALPGQSYSIDGKSYDFLAMNYLLTGTEPEGTDVQAAKRELMDASAEITFDGGKSTTVEVANMPVQRNYRTNIYGALLTSPLDLTIDVKPEFFETEINVPVAEPWDGVTVKKPLVNEEAKKVVLAEPAEFIGLAEMVNGTNGETANTFAGYTIELYNDLDFNGHEVPMIAAGASRMASVASGKAFSGVIDGKGKTISNFIIRNSGSESSATGFIASIKGADAAVKNLTFENVRIETSTSEQTALIGLLSNGATVANVHVKSGAIKGTQAVAGIVGRILSKGTVENCSNAASVTGSQYNIGGIVGSAYYKNNGMKIKSCTNFGEVSGTTAVGGVVGFNCADIEGCENTGTVTGMGTSIGGIVGEQQNTGNVADCHNSAAVINKGNGQYGTGGIVGWIRYSGGDAYYNKSLITVSGCSNSADVKGGTGVAGIVGMIYTYATVDRCTNTASILESNSNGFVSGIANHQSDKGNIVSALGDPKVIISNNISTTTLNNMITGNLKAQFIYVNDSAAVTEENNSDTL